MIFCVTSKQKKCTSRLFLQQKSQLKWRNFFPQIMKPVCILVTSCKSRTTARRFYGWTWTALCCCYSFGWNCEKNWTTSSICAKGITLKRTKATYTIVEGIGREESLDIIDVLKNQTFSILLDVSIDVSVTQMLL